MAQTTFIGRQQDIENMTFAGIVAVCREASIDIEHKSLRDLKNLLEQSSTISLDAGRIYMKTSQIVAMNAKRITTHTSINLPNQPLPSTSIVLEGTSESSTLEKELLEDTEPAFSNLVIEPQSITTFRVPMNNNIAQKKKSISVVLRNDSTFLGAFTTKRDLAFALATKFPNVNQSLFSREEGYEDIRVISFSGDGLLQDE